MSRKRLPPDAVLEETARRYWRALALTYRPGGASPKDFVTLRDVAVEAGQQLRAFMPTAAARALLDVLAGHASAAPHEEHIRRRNSAAMGKRAAHSAKVQAMALIARAVDAERQHAMPINATALAKTIRATLRKSRCEEVPSEVTLRRWIAEARKRPQFE